MLFTILIILLILALVGGGVGWGGNYGYVGWSPLVVILVIVAILYFTGAFR